MPPVYERDLRAKTHNQIAFTTSILIDSINMKKTDENRFYSLTTEQACASLEISRGTLYAYVSRGLIRAIKDPNENRRSLYDRRDVARLRKRRTRGRSRSAVAASTIDWGEPVLASAITHVADGALFYRGHDAVQLSRSATLEEIGQLLIGARLELEPSLTNDVDVGMDIDVDIVIDQAVDLELTPYARIMRCLARLATIETPIDDAGLAGPLLWLTAQYAAGIREQPVQPIHRLLAKAWSDHSEAGELIRRALVLCADHELNASTYAARVSASAGAILPACLLSGLATLSGSRHGGQTPLCLEWMKAAEDQTNRRILRNLQERTPPGFGHHLYPEGDPRAREILAHCEPPGRWTEIVELIEAESGMLPNLDFGLAALANRLDLPDGAAFGLFAVGRTAGWIAHSLEQRSTDKIIRPRASYVETQR